MIEVQKTYDIAQIEQNYRKMIAVDALVDDFGFRMAGLSSAFHHVHAVVAFRNGQPVGILPLVMLKDEAEIIGQYWSEGYRLPFEWDVLRTMIEAVDTPLRMCFCSHLFPYATPMSKVQAFLPVVPPDQYLKDIAHNRLGRNALKQVNRWYGSVSYVTGFSYTTEDINLFVRLSIERLGEASQYTVPARLETFVGVLNHLWLTNRLLVIHYIHEDKVVGIDFCGVDRTVRRLMFLSGFFEARLSGLGKYMYFVKLILANQLGMKEVIGYSPYTEVKQIMGYQPRTMYELVRPIKEVAG
jgi:hypothetical protein